MKTLEMWLKSISKIKEYLFCVLFGVYVAGVLWITLFSRIEIGRRSLLFPFYSYIEISKGNMEFFLENIENVVLFIPFGILIGVCKKWKWKNIIIIGFCSSLTIEIFQLIFELGTFEFDDLFHNTIGMVTGYTLVKNYREVISLECKHVCSAFIVFIIACALPFLRQEIQYQHMSKLAILHNREDGTENLLVLNGQNGYAWDTDVNVKYLDDGSISIIGSSDKKSWFPIGKLQLGEGSYLFGGLSGVERDTVGLVIEVNNQRIIDDVGPVSEIEFCLEEPMVITVYVIVYPGCNCNVIATPVIYKVS